MDILGIGPLELVFILIIILIVMGPKDIVKSSRTVGKFLRTVMTHPTFRLVQDTSREIRNLPYRLAREAGIDDLQNDLKSYTDLPKISPFEGNQGQEDPGLTEQIELGLGSWENPSQGKSPQPSPPASGTAPPKTTPSRDAAAGKETPGSASAAEETSASDQGQAD